MDVSLNRAIQLLDSDTCDCRTPRVESVAIPRILKTEHGGQVHVALERKAIAPDPDKWVCRVTCSCGLDDEYDRYRTAEQEAAKHATACGWWRREESRSA